MDIAEKLNGLKVKCLKFVRPVDNPSDQIPVVPEVKKYKCSKCNKLVELVYFPGMSNETFKTFSERLSIGLCRDCFHIKKLNKRYYK